MFDELLNYAGYERHECLALFEGLSEHAGSTYRWIGVKHKGCQSAALQILNPGTRDVDKAGTGTARVSE